ncbi:hypothetical protein GX51_07946, partial [Blastomyces parvus]
LYNCRERALSELKSDLIDEEEEYQVETILKISEIMISCTEMLFTEIFERVSSVCKLNIEDVEV